MILWEIQRLDLFLFPKGHDIFVSADSITQLVRTKSSPRALIIVVIAVAATLILSLVRAVMNAVFVRLTTIL